MRATLRLERTRWLESVLVVLAIGLSVAVVIVAGSILGSNERRIAAFDESLEARRLVVTSVAADDSAYFNGAEARRLGTIYTPQIRFTQDDVAAAMEAAPSVDYWYELGSKGFDTTAWDGVIAGVGVTPDYLAALPVEVVDGSLPTADDFAELRPVMLVTKRFATALELSGDLIGQQVYFVGEPAPYTIVGILPSRDDQPISIREAIVPMAPSATTTELTFAVEDAHELPAAAAQLRDFVARRWGDAAVVVVRDSEFVSYYHVERRRHLAIATLASAALLVAGCNVMGLLLSRAARDELRIGIARTLGASRGAVMRRVMFESGVMGVVGGVFGAAASTVLLRIYNASLATDSGNFQVQFTLSLPVIGLGLVVAVSLCLGAAAYPGFIASRRDITEAIGGA